MKFRVKRKTGFVTNDRTVKILDRDGLPFYYMENVGPNFKFNLPPGEFFTDNKLTELMVPVTYTMPPLKRRYNFMLAPKRFRYIYANNPNKCSVDLLRGLVIFDKSFEGFPRFVKAYIKYHELGHYRYSGKGQVSEKDCDDFSFNCMIKAGYNPAQVVTASEYTLENNLTGLDRKNNTFNYAYNFRQI
jgi:hypothetical protein